MISTSARLAPWCRSNAAMLRCCDAAMLRGTLGKIRRGVAMLTSSHRPIPCLHQAPLQTVRGIAITLLRGPSPALRQTPLPLWARQCCKPLCRLSRRRSHLQSARLGCGRGGCACQLLMRFFVRSWQLTVPCEILGELRRLGVVL
eukprot:scaffold1913_cov257-Pinguiococcus_pyrenoidosus.AAC.33